MRFTIDNKPGVEKVVNFKLVQHENGDVSVKANGYYILTFYTNGKINRRGSAHYSGLPCDGKGRIIIENLT